MGVPPTGAAVPLRLRPAPNRQRRWRSAGARRPKRTNARVGKAGPLPVGAAFFGFWRSFLLTESCWGFGRGQPHLYSATAVAGRKLQAGCRVWVVRVSRKGRSVMEAPRTVGVLTVSLPATGRSATFPAGTARFAEPRRSECPPGRRRCPTRSGLSVRARYGCPEA
jgi:hypothetical protein